jgi:hypothetical protein
MSQKQVRQWVRGLVGAAINGGATAITVSIVDPLNFNPMNGGAGKLLTVAGISALVGSALYLKQHPLPEEETV